MEEIIALLEQIKEQLAVRSKLLLSVDEAAKLLGLSPPTVRNLAYTADFPATKIGTRTMISAKGLAEWVDRQTAKPM